jgi:hypothetical protein
MQPINLITHDWQIMGSLLYGSFSKEILERNKLLIHQLLRNKKLKGEKKASRRRFVIVKV